MEPCNAESSESLCWICHEGAGAGVGPLLRLCSCMPVHRACLARWQLLSAGKPAEKHCRFCGDEVPDWRVCWRGRPTGRAVMTVVHEGEQHEVPVWPGPGGRQAFEEAVRRICHLGPRDELTLTFGCAIPPPRDTIWESSAGGAVPHPQPSTRPEGQGTGDLDVGEPPEGAGDPGTRGRTATPGAARGAAVGRETDDAPAGTGAAVEPADLPAQRACSSPRSSDLPSLAQSSLRLCRQLFRDLLGPSVGPVSPFNSDEPEHPLDCYPPPPAAGAGASEPDTERTGAGAVGGGGASRPPGGGLRAGGVGGSPGEGREPAGSGGCQPPSAVTSRPPSSAAAGALSPPPSPTSPTIPSSPASSPARPLDSWRARASSPASEPDSSSSISSPPGSPGTPPSPPSPHKGRQAWGRREEGAGSPGAWEKHQPDINVVLSGWAAFDAAVFCAALSSGRELTRKKGSAERGGGEPKPLP